MANQSPKHLVVSCLKTEVEETLDAYGSEYELIGMTSCQVGSGFGSHVEVLLAFRLCQEVVINSGPALPPGRQRRSPFEPIVNGQKKDT